MKDELLLEMRNIRKSFGPNVVLDDVSISLRRGEVLGLIGENGAGKSTLIKILCGIYPKDSGEIRIHEKPVDIKNARDAQELGISTIYQELSVLENLTAVQNIFINRELVKGKDGIFSALNEKEMQAIADRILHQEMKTRIPINQPTELLSLAQKQMIEIARIVYADAQIIIMDEPTASLQAKERDELFKIIRELQAKGCGIIFISHHLDELLEICDSIAILRDGHKVSEGSAKQFTVDQIIEQMIGETLKKKYVKSDCKIGKELLCVDHLGLEDVYDDVSFSLHRGEVLGIIGLEGCGKNEVLRTLFGLYTPTAGRIKMNGEEIQNKNVKAAMNHRFAFLPAERKVEGLFLQRDLAWNMSIAAIDKVMKKRTIMAKLEDEQAKISIKQLKIKTEGPKQGISSLSGGNQQKVMLARWMMTDADVFMMEEPTRGIDVNAKTEVYAAIADCVEKGNGVIVVSSEEEEVLGICDRIIVMRNGAISAVFNANETNAAEIKKCAVRAEADSEEIAQ